MKAYITVTKADFFSKKMNCVISSIEAPENSYAIIKSSDEFDIINAVDLMEWDTIEEAKAFVNNGYRPCSNGLNSNMSLIGSIERREKALAWWRLLTFESKFYKTVAWLKLNDRDTTERHPDNLTGREIEQIWHLDNLYVNYDIRI